MTEITSPTSPIDACPPATPAVAASAPAGTGFQDTLAGAVTRATSDLPMGSVSDTASGPGSAPGAATPGAAKPVVTAVARSDTLPDTPPGALPAAALVGKALETPGGTPSGAVMRERPGPDRTKDVGHRKGKDDPAHADAAPTEQSGQPAPAQIAPNGCNPISVVVAAPMTTDTQSRRAGDPDQPGVAGVKDEAGKPAPVPLDGTASSIVGAHKVPQAPPVLGEPAANTLTAFGAVLSGAAQSLAPTSTGHPVPAISTPASPTASPSPARAPDQSPAAQVAPAVVSLASGGAGMHRLVVRLDPPDLGRVEVRMSRGPDTGATVEVVVERPATLTLLRQDAPALHQALSDAGVPTQGRSLTMQLGHPGGQELTGQGGGGQGAWSPRRFGTSGLGSAPLRVAGVQFLAPRALRSALDITA